MIAFQVDDIKQFMLHLFSKDTFDAFWLYEAKIKMGVSYVVDGALSQNFYDTDEWEALQGRSYALWKEQKQVVFSMIRGQKPPQDMQIIFMLSPLNTEKMLMQSNLAIHAEDVRGLFLNIHYKEGKLSCTTGVSLRTFTLEKSLDHMWEDMIQRFMKQKKISVQLV